MEQHYYAILFVYQIELTVLLNIIQYISGKLLSYDSIG